MTALFNRVWGLEVGPSGGAGLAFDGMRLRFSATRGRGSGGASCSLTAWNPSRTLMDMLATSGTLCRVLAGYRDGGAQEVFQGTVVNSSLVDRRGSRDPHIEWQLEAVAAALASVELAEFIEGPASAADAIERIRLATGLASDAVQLGTAVNYARGISLMGDAEQLLDDLCATTGSTWSMPDGRLRVRPLRGAVRESADLWSSSTCLVETSGPTDKGRVRASALLRPALRPGDVVRIVDQVYSGDVVVEEVTHAGDSDGRDWYTSIVAVPR